MEVRSLEKVPLFRDLPFSELEYLAATQRVKEVAPDTILMIEGDIGDRFYIIISGNSKSSKPSDGQNHRDQFFCYFNLWHFESKDE